MRINIENCKDNLQNELVSFEIEKTITLTREDVDDIMCGALEGGITYWCCYAEPKDKIDFDEIKVEYLHEIITKGYSILLHDSESDEVYELNLEKLCNGIKAYYNDNPNITVDEMDAMSYDSIVQYALFDKIIYG